MITVFISSNGKKIDPTLEVFGVDISVEFNRIPWARLSLLDGDAALPEFKAAYAKELEPGRTIKISIQNNIDGRDSDPAVFEGIVVGQRLELDAGQSVLIVDVQDITRRMNGGRQTRVFDKSSDTEILRKLVAEINGLQVQHWQESGIRHDQMVQFDCTDWDFLVSRAEANGYVVSVENGSVSLLKADAAPTKVHRLINGNSDIFDLEMQSDADDLFKKTTAVSWNIREQKINQSSEINRYKPVFGEPAGSANLTKVTLPVNRLLHGGITSVPELNAWSNAVDTRLKLSVMRGRVSVPGMSGLQLGDYIDLKGLGNRFSGQALISGYRHRIDPGSWTTDIQMGLSAEPFWKNEHINSPPAAGRLPGVNGLQIGVVTEFQPDHRKEYRVGVRLVSATEDTQKFLWARLAVPDSGNGRGYFFYPEKDDEVILGFLNDDPTQPIILGSLFGSRNKLPAAFKDLKDQPALKGIFTKSGHSLVFDDEEKSIAIRTSAKNGVLMDEGKKKIQVSDEHGNIIEMSEEGISIKSSKAIKFEVNEHSLTMNDSGVVLKSAKKMTIEATNAMELKGAQIDLK